jgi:2-dehydro-3-deoxygluconokinase
MLRITCIGEVMVELHLTDRRVRFGGDTANVAVYLSRSLGPRCEITYVTGLGSTPASAWLRRRLADEAVSVWPTLPTSDREPGVYAIDCAPDGERSFSYWREESAARHFFQSWPREQMDLVLSTADLVVVSGITAALMAPQRAASLIHHLRACREAGARIAFDTNYRPRLWPGPEVAGERLRALGESADIVLTTLEDEASLWGMGAADQIIRHWQDLGVPEIVVRDGARGCVAADRSGVQHVASSPVAAKDTTAAGDAHSAGYLARRLLGESREAAAAYANALAAHIVRHPGAIAPRDASVDFAK